MVGALLATTGGPTVTADGVSYLRLAQGLPPLEGPGNHFPLGYPAALAIMRGVGFGHLDAARWLSALLAGTNVLLAGAFVRRTWGAGWSLVVMVVLAAATPLAQLHTAVLSEPLFLTLLLVWLLLMRAARESALVALGAGGIAAAAVLTRFAGAALVVAGLVLLVQHRSRLAAYAIGAGAPLAVWFGVMALRGTDAARTVRWHPASRGDVVQAARSAASWILGSTGPALAGFAVALGAAALLWRARRSPGGEALLVAAGCYVAVIGVTVFLLDAQTPLDTRLLAPIQLLVVLSLPAAEKVLPRALIAVGVTAVVLVTGAATIRSLTSPDLAVLSASRGDVTDAVGELPGTVWSNGPPALWLHSGREALPLPRVRDPWSLERNDRYDEEMAALRASSGDLVVWLEYFAYRDYLPSRQDLEAHLDLQPVAVLPDGVVYRVP